MQFQEGGKKKWDEWVTNNQDSYGGAVIEYARRWMLNMEESMAGGATLEECWESVQPKGMGITGFQYGAAVSVVATTWHLGDALRRLHNLRTQIGDEGERANDGGGVLNPALLRIG